MIPAEKKRGCTMKKRLFRKVLALIMVLCLVPTWGSIASYAGETLPGAWLSSLDEYVAGWQLAWLCQR